jgi:hypothetical protein
MGTIGACAALILILGSGTALAFESPLKYGVELRGGFGQYDLSDVRTGVENMHATLNKAHIDNTLNKSDFLGRPAGPAAGLSFLYRPSKHTMWEVGYNALLEVTNTVDAPDTASGEILMHASEFFLKGYLVGTPSEHLHLNLGAGVAYYNANLQIQDNYRRHYYYDATGRAFGLIASAGVELLPLPRFGIVLQGGARVANTQSYSYEVSPGTRTNLPIIGATSSSSRTMEVNLSGVYGLLGLRLYFDKVTRPVDYSR